MALKGLKVIELAGLAPAPFCGMILADFGASVIRVDKPNSADLDCLANGKRSIILDLKSSAGINIFKKLCKESDVLIDPFRHGVMERLNLGPKHLMNINKRLIFARITGFGKDGPFSNMAGHDLNYLGLSGILSLIGRYKEKPLAPVNLAADFGGGGLMCALGIVLALYERSQSKMGQIVDVSMVEGTAYLGSWLYRSQNLPGIWGRARGKNYLDSGAHFYDTYETKDGNYIAVAALEPQFYEQLLEKLNLTDDELPHFENFDENRSKLTNIFKKKTQKEWCNIFDGTDACVTPVLTLNNAATHKHNLSQNSFSVLKDSTIIPNPSPKLSRTPGISCALHAHIPIPGENTSEILKEYAYLPEEIEDFISKGIVQQSTTKSKL